MQIALVAVVLLAGMWFTVLKPKSADSTSSAPVAQTQTQASEPVAPGVKGLTADVAKAKAASATSDAANAKIQAATGGTASTAAPAAAATPTPTATATVAPKHTAVARKATPTATATRKPGTKAATAKAVAARPAATTKPATVTKTATAAKPAAATAPRTTTAAKPAAATATKPAAAVDPSDRLLAFLKKGKTLVVLFYGRGADDKAARRAVHQTALSDPKHVITAYVPISKVGDYEAITSDVNVLAAPTILVISTTGRATPLTGYVDAAVVRNAVATARATAGH